MCHRLLGELVFRIASEPKATGLVALFELFGDGRSVDPTRASAVYFSIHGAQPLADMLAGGDYDGDLYYVIQERELLELCAGGLSGAAGGVPGPGPGPVAQSVAQPTPHDAPLPPSAAALEEELQRHFLTLRHDASVAVGTAEVNHQAAVDKLGLHHPISEELGELYVR